MLSIGVVRSSMAAASYFAKDNYYTQHEEGPSHWFGAGAEKLGLAGEVEAGRFKQLLEGRIDAETRLGRIRDGEHQHRHGWDLTFSAPKSVSLAALVGGDERLVAAHDAAVREALGWLQDNAMVTCAGQDGQTLEESTGRMVAAVFRHDLSRAAEPQLHSHAVVMNATIGSKGQWQSVHSIRLYVNAKEAGERYQQALAARAAELGYAVLPSRNGTFELDGVPRDVTLLFSSRAKAVEARLAEQGLTRASATLAQREEATLRTRGAKPEIDRALQRSQDRVLARRHGLDLERFVTEAQQRSQVLESTFGRGREHAPSQERMAERQPVLAAEPALRAVREAAAILTERDAAFTARSLEQRARQMTLGTARAEQIDQAVAQLQSRGELVERQVLAIDPVTRQPTLMPGYTTAAMIQTERRMLALEQAGRGRWTVSCTGWTRKPWSVRRGPWPRSVASAGRMAKPRRPRVCSPPARGCSASRAMPVPPRPRPCSPPWPRPRASRATPSRAWRRPRKPPWAWRRRSVARRSPCSARWPSSSVARRAGLPAVPPASSCGSSTRL